MTWQSANEIWQDYNKVWQDCTIHETDVVLIWVT
jgi:hypothetical protein